MGGLQPAQPSIFFTRPTAPLSRRTLIPCGCSGDLVKMSLIIPSVSLPVFWSNFNTIATRRPAFISDSLVPSICCSAPAFTFGSLVFGTACAAGSPSACLLLFSPLNPPRLSSGRFIPKRFAGLLSGFHPYF